MSTPYIQVKDGGLVCMKGVCVCVCVCVCLRALYY